MFQLNLLEKKNIKKGFGQSFVLQPKLKIGQPDDKYKREADGVADKVMNAGNSETILMQAIEDEEEPIQMKCANCENEEEMLQPKFMQHAQSDSVPENIQSQINNSRGSGTGMVKQTRSFMEKRFGSNFNEVNIHNNNSSARLNNQLNAQAFTVGNDIFFNRGKYNPDSHAGKLLLAHELTHVVQQNGGAQKIQRMSAADALTIAQGLNTTYPDWLNVLPDCPCTYDEAMANPDVWKDSTSPFSSWFHPGAAHDVRTKHGYRTIPDSSHGQQCTYDDEGKLITSGPGAGTPDAWSPETNFWNHQSTDVDTYKAMGSNVYVRYWTPNNGNNCEANVGGGGNVSLTPSSEAKIVAIRDLLYGWTSEADIRAIISILARVTSRTEMSAIRGDIAPILVSNLSDIGDRTRIRVALARL